MHSEASYQANTLNEDRSVVAEYQVGPQQEPLRFFAVFDGHGGFDCSEFLRVTLADVVNQTVSHLLSTEPAVFESPSTLQRAMGCALKFAFRVVDDAYMVAPKTKTSGSCALCACFFRGYIFFANVGDSRALLCRRKRLEGATKSLARAMTTDQDASNKHECQLVQQRTKDTNPIRPSPLAFGVDAPLRVAGSLMVTRAMGDFYLKKKELSFAPYARFVPYITCEPVVRAHKVRWKGDRFFLLASDGLYNWMTNDEIVSIVDQYLRSAGADKAAVSRYLIDWVLEHKVAPACRMSLQDLQRVPTGRRRFHHDDITVVIVMINRPTEASAVERVPTLPVVTSRSGSPDLLEHVEVSAEGRNQAVDPANGRERAASPPPGFLPSPPRPTVAQEDLEFEPVPDRLAALGTLVRERLAGGEVLRMLQGGADEPLVIESEDESEDETTGESFSKSVSNLSTSTASTVSIGSRTSLEEAAPNELPGPSSAPQFETPTLRPGTEETRQIPPPSPAVSVAELAVLSNCGEDQLSQSTEPTDAMQEDNAQPQTVEQDSAISVKRKRRRISASFDRTRYPLRSQLQKEDSKHSEAACKAPTRSHLVRCTPDGRISPKKSKKKMQPTSPRASEASKQVRKRKRTSSSAKRK